MLDFPSHRGWKISETIKTTHYFQGPTVNLPRVTHEFPKNPPLIHWFNDDFLNEELAAHFHLASTSAVGPGADYGSDMESSFQCRALWI